MLLDLAGLSLRSGERYESVLDIEVAPVTLGGARYDVLMPSGANVFVDRVAGGFLVKIIADVKLSGPCARCLEEVVLETRAEQQEFAPTAKGGWEETDLSPFIKGLEVDLSSLAREAVILALPLQFVCSLTCQGLCPRCGRDLNHGSCDCSAVEIDDRWSKLRDIAFDDRSDS
jgi:uncharacterized protein